MKKNGDRVAIKVVKNGLEIADCNLYGTCSEEAVYNNMTEALKDALVRLLGKKEDHGAREVEFLDALISLSQWAIESKLEILTTMAKKPQVEPEKKDSTDDGIPF